MANQEDQRLTLKQLRIKARLSKPELGHMAGLDYRTVTSAELIDNPVYELTAEKILDALRTHFARYPEYVKGFEVPQGPEDVRGLVIYQAALHKGRKKQEEGTSEEEAVEQE